jgi:hypothetical protein
MSKITDLKEKYLTITENTFNRFVSGDKTPTKKYLEFFLKSWVNRKTNHCPTTIDNLISLVNKFDELVPYIEKKDIYDPIYKNLMVLKNEIERVEIIKEEKTFDRDEHCRVLIETDDYLLIRPKTLRGSLKYGSSTKWCVASKNDTGTFKTYTNEGLLLYLIDKSNTKKSLVNKVAFYLRYGKPSFNEKIELYNTYDTKISNESSLVDGGWDIEIIANALQIFRSYHNYMSGFKQSKDYVTKIINSINNINVDRLEVDLRVIGRNEDEVNINSLILKIDDIHKKIKSLEYGITKA